MRRPDLTVLFAPVQDGSSEVARAFLDIGQREFSAQIKHGYGGLELDPSKGDYHPGNETIDRLSADDLMKRITRDRNCVWGCDMLWYEELLAEVRVAIFRDPGGNPETTLMLIVDPKVTRLVEDEEEGRMPFVLFLCRIADAIGSTWFVGGPHVRSWRPLTLDQLPGGRDLGQLYVVGWKHDSSVAEEILRYYSLEPEGLGTTLLGYDFWAMFSLVT
jgi:hypothetical protein